MMAIGTLHRVDSLGRLVLPKEMRDFFHIAVNDKVEIVPTEQGILIRQPEYEVCKISKRKHSEQKNTAL